MLLSLIANILKKENQLKIDANFNTNMQITSIGCDSRSVSIGQLFFVKGVNFKREYLEDAVRLGAICYVSEKDFGVDIPVILVNSIRTAMPVVAKIFYNNPASKYLIAGVTGTKGKTTVTHMLYNVLALYFGHEKVGMVSTNGAWSGTNDIHKSGGSTPEALELYSLLDRFALDGIKAACMEVSSQALQYNRVDGIEFDVGAFINLGTDHISPTEHHNFAEYKSAKKRMLTLCKYGVVNIDDPYATEFIEAASCKKICTIAQDQVADFKAENIIVSKRGSSFCVNGELYEVMIPGVFNVYNALSVIAMATILGCDSESIHNGIRGTSVEGRMEIYERDGITVVVDYAHNEVSFEAVFEYLNEFYAQSRKICLFGCQGNKALDRRRELPAVAGKHADFIILSTDDPENEDPLAIINEVEIEVQKTGIPYIKIEDRETAVKYAIDISNPGDVIFLAGKGREVTQKIHGHSVPYKGDMPCAIESFNTKG